MLKHTHHRTFLLAVLGCLGFLAAVLAGCSGGTGADLACAPGEGPVTHGPRVGHVTETTARIWVRGCQSLDVNVQYRPEGSSSWSVLEAAATETRPSRDGTAVVELQTLDADTTYEYQVIVDGAPSEQLAGRFRTPPEPGSPGTVTVLLGADIRPEGSRAVFDTMTAQNANFAMLIGDQIYVDPQLPPEEPFFDASSKRDYEEVYRAAWAEPVFRRFLSETSTLLMWDDHEILNDWDNQDEQPYAWARAAYEEYQHSANPPAFRPEELYYVVRAGDAEFFVLDERSYRSANNQRDDQLKTMLGRAQRADLMYWLLDSRAKFKFIVSPVMWSDHAKHTAEAWISFRNERNQVLDFVTDHGVSGVMLLSGDEHWTGTFRLEPWGLYELSPTPLAGFSGTPTDSVTPDVLFKLGQTAVFGSVTINIGSCPASVMLRVIDAFGQERYSLTLDEAMLTPGVADAQQFCTASESGNLDSDHDGCADAIELAADETRGGGRDPNNHWDFYDVNGDAVVDSRDALEVADLMGAGIGDNGYDPSFDRSEPADGGPEWLPGPPDGVIDDADVLLVTAQAGHSCSPGPG